MRLEGYVTVSRGGVELRFGVIADRYERGSTSELNRNVSPSSV